MNNNPEEPQLNVVFSGSANTCCLVSLLHFAGLIIDVLSITMLVISLIKGQWGWAVFYAILIALTEYVVGKVSNA